MKTTINKYAAYIDMTKIALPAMLESLLTVFIAVIDTKMISVMGDKAISAVSLTTQPKIFVLSVFFALSVALSVFVAVAKGKNDGDEARQYLFSILKLGLAASFILGAFLFAFARPVMEIVSKQKETVALSADFFGIVMGLMIFQVASVILNGALRGLGNTNVTLIAAVAFGAADICFNYLLIEGNFGFPRLGVTGNAIATVLGSAAALTVSFFAVKRNGFLGFDGFFEHRFFKYPKILSEIKSKAGNIVLENLAMRIGFLISGVIVSLFPATDTAVYFVGMLLMNFSFACGDGLQSAATAILGQRIGKGDIICAKKSLTDFLKAGLVASFALSFLYIIFADDFFGAYFKSSEAISQGKTAACFVAAITFFQIERIITAAALRAAGETKLPRQAATLCVTVINPAASFILAYGLSLGITGIWQASLLTQILWFMLIFVKSRKYF